MQTFKVIHEQINVEIAKFKLGITEFSVYISNPFILTHKISN